MPATRAPRPSARKAPPPSSFSLDQPAAPRRPTPARERPEAPPAPLDAAPERGPQLSPLVPIVILAVPILLALLANFLSAPAQ